MPAFLFEVRAFFRMSGGCREGKYAIVSYRVFDLRERDIRQSHEILEYEGDLWYFIV